jgi:hypothetical protein
VFQIKDVFHQPLYWLHAIRALFVNLGQLGPLQLAAHLLSLFRPGGTLIGASHQLYLFIV